MLSCDFSGEQVSTVSFCFVLKASRFLCFNLVFLKLFNLEIHMPAIQLLCWCLVLFIPLFPILFLNFPPYNVSYNFHSVLILTIVYLLRIIKPPQKHSLPLPLFRSKVFILQAQFHECITLGINYYQTFSCLSNNIYQNKYYVVNTTTTTYKN